MSRCIRATASDRGEQHIGSRREKQHASDADLLHPVRHCARNTRGRDFVVGDLHGCFSKLDAELAARAFDPARDRLFSVGDLTDRGLESSAVLDVVQRCGIRAVRGNHEQGILDWALRDDLDPEMIEAMCDDPARAIAKWSYRDGRTSQLVYDGGQRCVELYCESPTRPEISCVTSLRCPMPFRLKPHTG